MNARSARAVLVLLALSAALVGLWALFAPASFYAGFPAGRGWVRLDGAYNEHLLRDVGALNLSLAVGSAAVAVRPRPGPARLVGAAWLVYAVPHFAYHSGHLPADPVDAAGNVVSLGAVVLLAVAACLPWRTVSASPVPANTVPTSNVPARPGAAAPQGSGSSPSAASSAHSSARSAKSSKS